MYENSANMYNNGSSVLRLTHEYSLKLICW